MKKAAICSLSALLAATTSVWAGSHSSRTAAVRLGSAASADRQFTAKTTVGEAEVTYLSVKQGKKELLNATDVWGFAWVGSKKDTLVYATSGLYGQAGLWSWDPVRGRKAIIKAKHPSDEAFVLDAVRSSYRGIELNYRHGSAEAQTAQLKPSGKPL